MASSRVMSSSSSSPISDMASKSSIYSPAAADALSFASIGDPRKCFGSLSMEDLLGNIYGDNSMPIVKSPYVNGGEADAVEGETPAELVKGVGVKKTEEVTAGKRTGVAGALGGAGGGRSGSERKEDGEMTLEDFLAKAGAVMEEDVKVPSGFENPVLGFRNGMEAVSSEGGRGRRRPPFNTLDKVALQRQKRMIKNRESAARSRERKLAYTAELESLVHQLEEENAQLHAIMVEQNKQRLKQLMEKEIPVTLKKNTPKQLRKTRSLEW